VEQEERQVDVPGGAPFQPREERAHKNKSHVHRGRGGEMGDKGKKESEQIGTRGGPLNQGEKRKRHTVRDATPLSN